ncbi:hypothetical protein BD410DRAFT_805960 [Rickenella mellea]|uniref:Uncharacterized protein n=1 Tax=Rickenella mellea TaxID=50990 RepID=A0A4Y7PW87_9AGAM|nr:hypothetical protein BD410DRAFT_805960 [Rickenella mellea]
MSAATVLKQATLPHESHSNQTVEKPSPIHDPRLPRGMFADVPNVGPPILVLDEVCEENQPRDPSRSHYLLIGRLNVHQVEQYKKITGDTRKNHTVPTCSPRFGRAQAVYDFMVELDNLWTEPNVIEWHERNLCKFLENILEVIQKLDHDGKFRLPIKNLSLSYDIFRRIHTAAKKSIESKTSPSRPHGSGS